MLLFVPASGLQTQFNLSYVESDWKANKLLESKHSLDDSTKKKTPTTTRNISVVFSDKIASDHYWAHSKNE